MVPPLHIAVCRPDRDGDDDSDVCVSAALGRPITFWDAKWLVVVSALGGLSAAVRCRPARLITMCTRPRAPRAVANASWHTRHTGAASIRALRALQRSRTSRRNALRVGVFRAAAVCALHAVAPASNPSTDSGGTGAAQ